jgi:hypothetical protein
MLANSHDTALPCSRGPEALFQIAVKDKRFDNGEAPLEAVLAVRQLTVYSRIHSKSLLTMCVGLI